MSDNDCPEEKGEEGRRDDNSFDKKENSEFLNRHERQDGLNNPVEEEAEEASRSNSSVLWQVVRKALEAGPDSFNAILEKCTGLNTENGSPHCSNESTEAYGRV